MMFLSCCLLLCSRDEDPVAVLAGDDADNEPKDGLPTGG